MGRWRRKAREGTLKRIKRKYAWSRIPSTRSMKTKRTTSRKAMTTKLPSSSSLWKNLSKKFP